MTLLLPSLPAEWAADCDHILHSPVAGEQEPFLTEIRNISFPTASSRRYAHVAHFSVRFPALALTHLHQLTCTDALQHISTRLYMHTDMRIIHEYYQIHEYTNANYTFCTDPVAPARVHSSAYTNK